MTILYLTPSDGVLKESEENKKLMCSSALYEEMGEKKKMRGLSYPTVNI